MSCAETAVPAHLPVRHSKMQVSRPSCSLPTTTSRSSPSEGHNQRIQSQNAVDLVVNTMFKSAMADGIITVNNPSIWRPILSIQTR
jgi:hypothetical protein